MLPFVVPAKARSLIGVFCLPAFCLIATACSPADGSNSNNTGGAGAHSSGGSGSASGGSTGSSASGGSSATGGVVGTGGANSGGSIETGSGGGAAATGGNNSGSSGGSGVGGSVTSTGGSAGGNGGASGGGAGGSAVSPVPLDPSLMSKCTGSKPIKCTFSVPNGNYNVTVELGSAQAASSSQVEAELSRIVVPTVKLAAGVYAQHTFSVNVHNETHDDYTAPGMQLNILIDGDSPALHGLGYAAANIPTLFVAGDSTVCDWDPAKAGLGPTERGWAQEISIYMKPGIAVANYADSGDTAGELYSKFINRGAVLKKGDYIFIQFGHNDMKSDADRASYKTNLMKYVTLARNAMATPILFSPVARRAYLDDHNKATTLADPGFNGLDQQARDLAAAEKIAFVDLTTLAIKYYATVDAPALFTSRTEIAHFNIAGATAISKLVADALKAGTTPSTAIAEFFK